MSVDRSASLGVLLLLLPSLGCSSGGGGGALTDGGSAASGGTSGFGGASSGGGAPGGGSGGTANLVTLSGANAGEAPVVDTISGPEYLDGDGTQCELLNGTSFRIDARDGLSGVATNLLLQYWNFDLYETEREENFPLSPGSEPFQASITVYDGSELFIYNPPFDWSEHAAENPSCHTSFATLSATRADGTMTCQNVFNEHAQALASLTIHFACDVSTLP